MYIAIKCSVPSFCSTGHGRVSLLSLWLRVDHTDLPDTSCPSRGILWATAAGSATPDPATCPSHAHWHKRNSTAAVQRERFVPSAVWKRDAHVSVLRKGTATNALANGKTLHGQR